MSPGPDPLASGSPGERALFDLSEFGLGGMTRLGAKLREAGEGAESLEDAADRIVGLLYESLADASGAKNCVLARLFLTRRQGDLEPSLQDVGARLMAGKPLTPETRCLTLVATRGAEPAWCVPSESRGHQSIPLPSTEVVSSIPMVSQLLAQLGLDPAIVVDPSSELLLERDQTSYNVFFVPDALGSAHIPAQAEFVEPYGVRSVIGFGGLLPSGSVFAVLLFARVLVPTSTADMFRNAAMNTKLALLPFDSLGTVPR